MDAHDRRLSIWHSLCCHRFATVAQLAAEHGVSVRTIYNDIQRLSLSHPIETVRGRHYAGIRLPDWYRPNPHAYTPVQLALLLRLKSTLTGDDLSIMSGIIDQFSG